MMEKSDLRTQSVQKYSHAALIDRRESLHETANARAQVTADSIFKATLFKSNT